MYILIDIHTYMCIYIYIYVQGGALSLAKLVGL